jgi:hypothetical protein
MSSAKCSQKLRPLRRNTLRQIIVCLAVLVVAGCSTELTSQAQFVRQIPAETKSKCKFLGPVSAMELFGLSTAHDATSALNKVRNEVANRGGNAFVQNSLTSNPDGTSVQADAYLCP